MTQPTNLQLAEAAGYKIQRSHILESKYGPWRVHHKSDDYRPHGIGYRTRREALARVVGELRHLHGPDWRGMIMKGTTQ